MFQPMKSNNVALQLGVKRIAKIADSKEKIHFLRGFRSPGAGSRDSTGIMGRIS
jgi:hypothetical protein